MDRFWKLLLAVLAVFILGGCVAEGQPGWPRTLAERATAEKGWLELVAAVTAVVALVERILNALNRWKDLRKAQPATESTPAEPKPSALGKLLRFLGVASTYLLELGGIALSLGSLGIALQADTVGAENFEALYWMLGGGIGLFLAGRFARNFLLRKSPRANWVLSAVRTAFALLLVAAAIWGRLAV